MDNKNSISLEKALEAYRAKHVPVELTWKQHFVNEHFSSDSAIQLEPDEKRQYVKRLVECNVTIFDSIKQTTGGHVCTLLDLLKTLISPDNKNVTKINRRVIYPTSNGERPIGKTAFDLWNGFQVIDMDIKDEVIAKKLKVVLFKQLKKYNWFVGVALSSSGKGLHVYTKIQVSDNERKDDRTKKIAYLTNFRHKYSFVYLVCINAADEIGFTKEQLLKWMDLAMFKPQQGAFIGYDPEALFSTHFFEDFLYMNFDNVEDMGHPDVDWVTYPDLKEVFKRWEWFEDNDEDSLQNVSEDEFYTISKEDAVKEADKTGNKMILLEPRAYSESQQIADHLKSRNSVVVNLKRVTSAQAKRIIDFLSGCIYAIGGSMQKIGVGIYLCTPKNVNVQGKISDEADKKEEKDTEEIDW